jgi:tRNA uridine 5-carboxymethylaminomethyl modification enzyme
MEQYDAAIIGTGHAGIEAALACARLGVRTVVFSINLDSVGSCPCSPSIGGTAKGTLVREIDALGGEMAKTTDECFLHSKILNRGKGAAVQSIRAQIDKDKYKTIMKHKLEVQPNLHLKQAEIIDLRFENDFWEITTRTQVTYRARTVVIAAGTYTGGKIHIGEVSYFSGPNGIFPGEFLGGALKKLGIHTKRFKTGTSARILKSSINFSILEEQHGDEPVTPFSFNTENIGLNKMPCYIARTNFETKRIILENLEKSAIYSGEISGVGPRYCPSIEDKMVRFSEKESHQIFVEPCGINTEEIYLYGMSSSLPEDVQNAFYRSIEGFENSVIMRPAYAIEYDVVNSIELTHTLEFKNHRNLFAAGQINGSSGYEEAAAQGLVAGINAAMNILGKPGIEFARENSYIGVLIDDLVTKGVDEPYRMLTSCAEHRLLLRINNADERLTSIGRELGLVSDSSWAKFQKRIEQKDAEVKRIKKTYINFDETTVTQRSNNATKSSVYSLLKRPEITYESISSQYSPNLPREILERIEIEIKYEGYISLQKQRIKKNKKMLETKLPEEIDYLKINSLRLEAREKLNKYKPANLSAAFRISGITPADIDSLSIWLAAKLRHTTKEME